ncbi:MAG: hypothetical protein H6677_17825 [Candidatus Obscuribacterales bacterium]|nr:hypothetical protein [Candidatus Obscuribacterales bacterium]
MSDWRLKNQNRQELEADKQKLSNKIRKETEALKQELAQSKETSSDKAHRSP